MVANGFEGVPWMVGGGQAKHSANVGRLVAYAATTGQSGVIKPGDLKVSASTPTPDGKVHIGVGAVAIVNEYANAQSESYLGRATLVSDLDISPTGPGAGRSDLVVVRIKDPQYGWQTPADAINGPYAIPEIIPGVPSGTKYAEELNLQQALYAVARIDLPVNTSTITQGMINDLRHLAQPHASHFVNQQAGGQPELLTSSDWVNWPSNSIDIEVPQWATHAFVKATINTVVTDGNSSDFNPRISFGGIVGQSAAWDYNGSSGFGAEKIPFIMTAFLDIRTLAGTTSKLRTQAMRTFVESTGSALVQFDGWSQIIYEVDFQERIV